MTGLQSMGLPRPRKPRSFMPSGGDTDPFFSDVILLIRGEELTDLSSQSKTITNDGSAGVTIDSSLFKYGSASILFPAANGYLSFGLDPDFQFGNTAGGGRDFTIEWWGYNVSFDNNGWWGYSTEQDVSTGTLTAVLTVGGNTTIRSGVTPIITTPNPPADQWNHYAVVHRVGVIELFINGISQGTTTSGILCDDWFLFGVYFSVGFCADANIDTIRVTNNVGRYASNFDPEIDTFLAY